MTAAEAAEIKESLLDWSWHLADVKRNPNGVTHCPTCGCQFLRALDAVIALCPEGYAFGPDEHEHAWSPEEYAGDRDLKPGEKFTLTPVFSMPKRTYRVDPPVEEEGDFIIVEIASDSK